MALNRRTFLKLLGGTSAGAAILAACRPAVREYLVQSPARLPEDLVTGVDNWYATLCGEDDANCGVFVRVVEGRAKKIEGNPDYPMNTGKLSLRGQGGVQALYHPDRVRRPMRSLSRGSGRFQEVSWDEAMDALEGQLKPLKDGGDGASALLITDPVQGHMRMVASRFAEALGGATHAQFDAMDENVLKGAIQGVFGTGRLPEFDIANARYILSFGADFLMGWVAQVRHSRGYGEFRQGRRDIGRGTFVHVDTRFSGTAANADQWVPVRPGQEGKLAMSIASVIVRDGLGDPGAEVVYGRDPQRVLEGFAPDRVAAATGVPAERIEKIAHDFAGHQPGIAIGGGSAGAQTNGTFNLTAIYALNRLVGNVGKAGGVVLNPETPFDQGQVLWGARPFSEYTATSFTEWQRLVGRMQQGAFKVALLRNADPVHGMPSSAGFREALDRVPFVASFSSFLDDTSYFADLVLPTHLPLEDWGDGAPNPGPGFQTIGFRQPVVRPFQDTRGFGDLLLALAQGLGMERELPWTSFREVLREAAQTLAQLGRGSVSGASFEAFWNDLLRQGGWWDPRARHSAPAPSDAVEIRPEEPEFAGPQGGDTFNLVPFPGIGIGDGRNAHLPWMQAAPDPITTATWETWVELNSVDAEERGLKEGGIVRLDGPNGAIEAPVYPNPALPRGVVAVPVGQGHRSFGRYAEDRGKNTLAILAPMKDRETGALAWAATRVRLTPTGERERIPKFEGSVLPVDFDRHAPVVRG